MDLDKFKAPFIRPEQAWQEADRIRTEHWPSGQVPVEVEEILWKIGLRIDSIPYPGPCDRDEERPLQFSGSRFDSMKTHAKQKTSPINPTGSLLWIS